jgi:hypothetical protein
MKRFYFFLEIKAVINKLRGFQKALGGAAFT